MFKSQKGFVHGLVLILLLIGLVAGVYLVQQKTNFLPKAFTSGPVRGVAGDLWADIIIGQRDFSEIEPREIVPNRLFNPNGVVVDRSVSPGRAYVWDSSNNRVLGFDLGGCYANPATCSATIVLGQRSTRDSGACNGDSGFQNYPQRAKASASTLCGIGEWTHTVLEDKSLSNMTVDSAGNLYVPDFYNHRVLKYNNPFTTDNVADEVIGQDDFSGNECNKTGSFMDNKSPAPTNSSLCFIRRDVSMNAGAGIDASGNLWVADGGNNRVLRFPKGSDGKINKAADLVLGKDNFTSYSPGNGLNQMSSPAAVRFDSNGKLYVSDTGNNRILVFAPPFTSGMAGSVFNSDLQGPFGLEFDPQGRGLLVNSHNNGNLTQMTLLDNNGKKKTEFTLSHRSGGSLGIDAEGNVLLSQDVYGQDIYKFIPQADGSYKFGNKLLSAEGFNMVSNKRLDNSAWGGVAVVGDQLVVSLSRLLFWNNIDSLTSGKPADGYLGTSGMLDYPSQGTGQVKSDADNRIWTARVNGWPNYVIEVYQAPLHSGDQPIKVIKAAKVLGTGQVISPYDVHGIVPTPHGEFLWISEPVNNRVYRIKGPLTDNPVIDVVLGQKKFTSDDKGYECNRGEAKAPNNPNSPLPNPDRTMICIPGALSIDKKGNLFVSDHTIEAAGNWRLLMFSPTTFPDSPSSVIFAPSATKEFPALSQENSQPHMTFETAFDSSNRMVTGNNPYYGHRFAEYYNDPTKTNPNNPSDYKYALPDGIFKDFLGWPIGMTFDKNDNLYILDANRSRVLIYKKPFQSVITPTSTPTPTSINGIFSNPSAIFNQTTATYKFSYTGPATSSYRIDMSTLKDMSWDVYLDFGQGAKAPVSVSNPTKWDKYSCGRTLYWKIYDSNRKYSSPIQSTTINCVTNTPTPTPTPIPTPTQVPQASKRVFVTSTTYNGNLGGLSGADSKCQERANATSLGGTWKAWLSDSKTSASSRLTHSGPYLLLNGTKAITGWNNSWGGILYGALLSPINMTELKTTVSNNVWTNTSYNGGITNKTSNQVCNEWTNGDAKNYGYYGMSGQRSLYWTSKARQTCNINSSLYCFEQ